jgi:hypothetical protein
MSKTTPKAAQPELPPPLTWLADAPMFIDADQVACVYDAVIRPDNKEVKTTIQLTEGEVKKMETKYNLKAGLTTTSLAGLLTGVFAFLKPSIKASAESDSSKQTSGTSTYEIELQPIDTPQRQLVQLTLHYLLNQPDRLLFVERFSEHALGQKWYETDVTTRQPRAMLSITLPGRHEANGTDIPYTSLIPVAAEFASGAVVTYFDKYMPKPGQQSAPLYPDLRAPDYDARRKEYWKWFVDHFDVQTGVNLIEQSVREQKSRLTWIDFRLPIDDKGETLHLHIVPNGRYDTITFAYNFIRRGFEHGIRLIGLLKTDPDLNVLAIYER